jgi:glycosyltransferase involved in cell wall biosynthesis
MEIVLFSHPSFMSSQSMPRFAGMLKDAYTEKGYQVSLWSPKARAHKWLGHTRLAKWAGYVDQYLLFPIEARVRAFQKSPNTLFVFCDQALGPWVPIVKHRPHVVHAHDLLALRSALGLIPENPTSRSGQLYQKFIRNGFKQARQFICISERTKADLQTYGGVRAEHCKVVYNGLNFPYRPMSAEDALAQLGQAGLPASAEGMLLHVGGSQWYKNTAGIIHLYAQYAAQHAHPLPLWMVSPAPSAAVQEALAHVPPQGKVHFFQGIDNLTLQAAYSLSRAFLFPSLAEGFGWPIVEGLACGAQVITTNEAPMTEVGGHAAHYLPRKQYDQTPEAWAKACLPALEAVLSQTPEELGQRRSLGIAWAQKFMAGSAIDSYLLIYEEALRTLSSNS